MKGAGGEQKGGGWEEEEEEGEGVLANRLRCPHKDWPRTEGENREVGDNWVGGRGDPLLTCPRDRPPPSSRCAGWREGRAPVTVSSSVPLIPDSEPALNRYGPAPFPFSLFLVRFLHSEFRSGSAYFPRQTFTRVFPDHPPLRGPPHLVSPLPRGVSIPGASGALLSPSRAAAPDCPNAILESLAPAESCVWTSRAAAPKPRGGRGRAERGTVPGHPGPRRSPRRSGRAPSRGGAAAAAFPGFPGPGLGEAGDRRHGGRSLPSGSPLAPGRLSARPAGEGEPGSTARVAREGGDVSVAGWGDREGGSDVVPQRPSHGGGGGSKGCGVSGSCGLSGPGRRSPGVPGERPSAGQREGRSRVRGRGVRAQGQGAGSAEGRPRQRLPPPKPLRRLRRAPLGGGVRAPSP